ncbi:MAG TPA: hypothetical protein VH703_02535 [Solirubrobacterales bacterium]|jgi:hypothetical protein
MADSGAEKDKLDQTIERAAKSARESVDGYAELAREASARLSSGAPVDAGALLQLSARVYAQAAGDAAKAWTTGYELLQAFAERAEPPSPPDQTESPPDS